MLLADKARLEAAAAEEAARLQTAEAARTQAALLAELEGGNDGGGGEGGAVDEDADALDAFMTGVESQMEKDKVGAGGLRAVLLYPGA